MKVMAISFQRQKVRTIFMKSIKMRIHTPIGSRSIIQLMRADRLKSPRLIGKKNRCRQLFSLKNSWRNTLIAPRVRLSGIGSGFQIANSARLTILVSTLLYHKKRQRIIRQSLQSVRQYKVRLS